MNDTEKKNPDEHSLKEDTTDENYTFDDILDIVGSHGPFQKKFNWIFNFAAAFMLSMSFMNSFLAVATPEHWCHVPRNYVNDTTGIYKNYSDTQWRQFTVPFISGENGITKPSSCKMYRDPVQGNSSGVMKCQFGWEYNRTWYEETIVSEEDWVCDDEYYVTHSLVASRIGEFIGAIFFSLLGDSVGRKPIFIVTVISIVFGRVALIYTTGYYWLFMLISAMGSITLNTGFQSPLTIGLEISHPELRASITSKQYLGWTAASCVVPLIMWVSGKWDIFLYVTSVPAIIFLFFSRYLIESPRWLVSRGDIKNSYKQLCAMAKVNKRPVPDNLFQKLTKLSLKSEEEYSMFGLFTSYRLMKNTILLCLIWLVLSFPNLSTPRNHIPFVFLYRGIEVLCYQVLLYNVENLEGNPHLNLFYQGLIEIPSNFAGKYSCDHYGRRITQLIGFGLACVTSILTFCIIPFTMTYPTIIVIMTNFIKFFIAWAFYVLNLQSLEVYPTCMRQSGTSVSLVFALGASIFGPFIAEAGRDNVRTPYIFLFFLALVAAICGVFLPETKDIPLPETYEEARVFGANQKFWDFFMKSEAHQLSPTISEKTSMKLAKKKQKESLTQ